MNSELTVTELIADLHNQYILTGFPSFAEAFMALAAERDRADRAEARLAEAWDEGRKVTNNSGTWLENERRGTRTFVPTPNPYRSEATA